MQTELTSNSCNAASETPKSVTQDFGIIGALLARDCAVPFFDFDTFGEGFCSGD